MPLYIIAYSTTANVFRLKTIIRKQMKNLSSIQKLENKVNMNYTEFFARLDLF